MSFRARLLLVIVLVNLGVLGIVQVTTHILQAPAREEERRSYQKILEHQYQRAFAAAYEVAGKDELEAEKVRRVLASDVFALQFADMHVIHGEPLVIGSLALNPLGASMRSEADFDLEEVQAGIRESVREGKLLEVGSGFCVPIVVNDKVVAGAWVKRPFGAVSRNVPWTAFILPILLSILVFALLANWIVTRTIGRHIQTLTDTARRLGGADYSARVPRLGTSPEINLLGRTFNAMAAKVEGHTEELAREVKRATEEAKTSERALVVSARLASMGTLAAGIAHEINNPIGGMLNAVQRLSKREDLDDRDRVVGERLGR